MGSRRVKLYHDAIVLGAWVRYPKKYVNMAHVWGQLTLLNPAWTMAVENEEPTDGIEQFRFLFHETERYVYLPRHFTPDLLRSDLPVIRKPIRWADVEKYTTDVKPRDAIQEKAVAAFSGDRDGILCLAPGVGKTKTAIMVAANGQKFPMLVVVHNTMLLSQWREELSKCYGIEKADIGTVRGPLCQWQGRSVSVAMMSSLAKRNYGKAFYDYWKLIIADECVAEGSAVRMADGTQRLIQDVRVGDAVATPLGARRVLSVTKSLRRSVVTASVGKSRVKLTPDHPIAQRVPEDAEGHESLQWREVGQGRGSTAFIFREECLLEVRSEVSARSTSPTRTHVLEDYGMESSTASSLPGLRSVREEVDASPEEVSTRRAMSRRVSASASVRREGVLSEVRQGYDRPDSWSEGRSYQLLLRDGVAPSTVDGVRECRGDRGASPHLHVEGPDGETPALAFGADEEEQSDTIGARTPDDSGLLEGRLPVASDTLWSQRGEGWEGQASNGEGSLCLGDSPALRISERGVLLSDGRGAGTLRAGKELHGGLLQQEEAAGRRAGRQEPQEQGQARVECSEGRLPGREGDSGSALAGDAGAIFVAASGGCREFPLEVEDRGEVADVYDLGIEDARCFFANDILVHNCHRMGSETWSTILPKFQGQRMGLTATPDRPDGMDKAYRVHAGKVLYKYTKQQLKSEFVFVHTGLNIPTPRIRNPMKRWAMVQSYVGKHEPRNHMIANFLQEAFLEGRKLIVLGERVATLRWLCKGYPGKNKAVYNGDLPIAGPERAEALSKRAIFATASMAKEGLDVPSLDTLFITIPFSGVGRLSQSVGRILRVHDGKQAPRTYVFVDQHPSIRRNAQGMREWALKKGYAVKDIYPGDF